MLLDIDKQKYPILISLHKSGSTWINSFIHKRYRRIGLTTPPRNLYTEFFCKNRGENREHKFVQKTDEERIALLEQLRTFGLELNQKAHVPQIIPVWPWFKEFYKDYDILVCKRRHIFSHWINLLFFSCIREATKNKTEIHTKEGTYNIIPSKIKYEIDEDIFLDIFDGVPMSEISLKEFKNGIEIVKILHENSGFLSSNSEARRALVENSISINKNKVDQNYIVSEKDLIRNKFVIINRGKKKTFILKVKV